MSGQGTIEKLPDGTFRLWISAGRDDVGKYRRISERFGGSYRDAQRRLAALRADVDSGRYIARRKGTLAGFVEAWWPAKVASIAPTSARGYRQSLDSYILPSLGQRDLQKLSGAEISATLGQLTERGKFRSAEATYIVLKIVLNAAIKQGALARSPLAGVERPKVARRELTVLTPADWQRVREYLEARESWALGPLTVALTSGVRRSELSGLQWRDVDFEKGILHVRRAYHVLKGKPGFYREPKSERSRRAIALDARTVDTLRAQRVDAERTAAMFARKVADTDPVFARADNTPWPPDTFSGVWQRIAKTFGLDVRLHDLRHTSATLLLGANVPVQLVSQRLGHASAGFTLSTYAHVMPGAATEAAEKLAAILNEPRRVPALTAAG